MAKKKKEQVSISFHYLCRRNEEDSDDETQIPLSNNEFEDIFSGLDELRIHSINDKEYIDKISIRNEAAISSIEKLNPRTVCGIFRAPYSGHSFENSEKGKISASSVSFRPFFFMLYLAESGRLYIASQYLGNYGG